MPVVHLMNNKRCRLVVIMLLCWISITTQVLCFAVHVIKQKVNKNRNEKRKTKNGKRY